MLRYHRLRRMIDEDGVEGDLEDGELPRFEAAGEEQQCDADQAATERDKIAYDSWMKLVEESKQVKVKTLTFVEVIASRATGHVMEGIGEDLLKSSKFGAPNPSSTRRQS